MAIIGSLICAAAVAAVVPWDTDRARPTCPVTLCHDDADCSHLPGCTWCRDEHPGPKGQTCGGPPGPGDCGTLPGPANHSASLQYECFGDSVSKGIFRVLAPNLTALGWEPIHPSDNEGGGCGNTLRGKDCTAVWLDGATGTATRPERVWDVITFNYGLHDLAQDSEFMTLDQYRSNLLNITTTLAAAPGRTPGSKPKLFWVTSTPVPNAPLTPPRNQSDVPKYNAVAAEVIAQFPEIVTIDLYAFVLQKCGGNPHYTSCPGFQLPNNVHFEDAGWQEMAALMLKTITAAIGK